MKQSKFNQRKSSLDGRTCAIYLILLCFSLCWVFAVIKVFLLESARNTKPVIVADPSYQNGIGSNQLSVSEPVLNTRVEPPKTPFILKKDPIIPPQTQLQTYAPPVRNWPPVLHDGSIPTEDGYDVMTFTELKVPKFWTPDEGTPLEQQGAKVNGIQTIFLMIASYRDFQCRETITSAFKRADHPEALFIGAVDQVTEGDIGCTTLDVSCADDPTQMICKYWDQISIFKMEAELATGPVTARHVGDRMYRGQYFVMQMDAHCHFVRHWDTKIKEQWASTKNEMAVLSSYLTDYQGSIDSNGDSTRDTRPIMCNSAFEGMMPARYLRHGSQPEDYAFIRDMPQLQPFWAAGFSFSRGHFKIRVPYDGYQPMVFQVRPPPLSRPSSRHSLPLVDRVKRSLLGSEDSHTAMTSMLQETQWSSTSMQRDPIGGRRSTCSGRTLPSTKARAATRWQEVWPSLRCRLIFLMTNGTTRKRRNMASATVRSPSLLPLPPQPLLSSPVRSLELFYRLFLINPQKRESTQLCPFVKNGGMHREFQKFLRPDGLGIDYSHLEEFDTRHFLDEIFAKQRPGGEKLIENSIKNKRRGELENALENARRIGIDRTNPALYQRGMAQLKNNFVG
jgi:hypothetical protein